MYYNKILSFLLIAICLSWMSCDHQNEENNNKDQPISTSSTGKQQSQPKAISQEEKEEKLIEDYLQRRNLTAQKLPSGLYYIITEKGNGPKAEKGKTVKVNYTGKLLNGKVFDSSYNRGEPIEFVLGKNMVIPGWEQGIAQMHVGDKATLFIPSSLGYGSRDLGSIPPNSILIFDVSLEAVE